MSYIQAINDVNPEAVKKVAEEMKVLGAPVIRVCKCDGIYYALEGSHRLAAAWELGIEPEFVELDPEDTMPDNDLDDVDSDLVADLLDYVMGGNGERYDEYQFDPDFRDI